MKRKIDFAKLIGNYYDLQTKMAVLDWMLKTGKGITYSHGWCVDGINKSLLNYSANNHDVPVCFPKDDNYNILFDAIFARAIYMPENKPLKEWRAKENIYLGKYRMLQFNEGIPETKQPYFLWLIWDIYKFNGAFLKKEFHHPDYKERTDPKIIHLSISTNGTGWYVQYEFSFKEFDYEPGWTNGFHQQKNESIWEFIKRSYDELNNII